MRSLFTFCLCFFTLTQLWAAEITVSNTNDSGAGSLRQAVADAESGDEIIFAENLSEITLSSQIDVGKNLTIDGANRIILDGRSRNRIFTFTFETQITLRNITLRNGKSSTGSANPADDRGGAVRVHSRAKILFENVNFLDNEAGGYGGGAVGATGTNTQMTFRNCTFLRNKSLTDSEKGAGAVNLYAGGADTFLKMTDCTFEDNEGVNGGAVGSSARIDLERCLFRNNNTLTAPNRNYLGTNSSPRGAGGAVYTDRPEHSGIGHRVVDCDFIGNRGAATGGALFLFINSGNEGLVSGCYFENNAVLRGKYAPGTSFTPKGFGGAVFFGMNGATSAASKFILENSTFYKNTSVNEGGAVWISRENSTTRVGSAEIRNCTFTENSAEGGSENERRGGALTTYFDTEINNCTFSGNSAQDHSGAIYANPGTTDVVDIQITNSIFHQNTSGNNTQSNLTHSGSRNLQFPDEGTTALTAEITYENPLLESLAPNGGRTKTMALREGSPAIDAGSGCTATDQRGVSRVGNCDLGAYEFNPNVTALAEEITAQLGLKLYPNPAAERIILESDFVISEIKIFSLSGKKLLEQAVNARRAELEVSFLPKGVYFLKTGEGGVLKFVR